jgi:hypothetical protein
MASPTKKTEAKRAHRDGKLKKKRHARLRKTTTIAKAKK